MFYIVTKNTVPGYHFWKNAPDRLAFLKSRHRHDFVITARIAVNHDDRDLEIIETEAAIHDYLFERYGHDSMHIDIGGMSCEMLAKEIAEQFGAQEVAVQEDGQGGAVYVREEY